MLDVTAQLTREVVDETRTVAPVSPHVTDLSAFRRVAPVEKISVPRGLGRLRHLLDERIHLQDLRMRRVSTHPMDWTDFPSHRAGGLRHAVAIALRRFLTEHPLADLTVVTVLHVTALIAWRAVLGPLFRQRAVSVSDAVATANERSRDRAPWVAAAEPVIKVMPRQAFEMPQDGRGAVMVPSAKAARTEHRPVRQAPRAWPRFRFSFPEISFPKFSLPTPNAAAFAAVAAVLMLPAGAYGAIGGLSTLKDRVVADGMRGADMLRAAVTAAESKDFFSASAALQAASDDFSAARRKLGALGVIMDATATVLPIDTVATSPAPLLTAGAEAAAGGAELTAALAAADSAATPIAKFRVVRDAAERALPRLLKASAAVAHVDPEILPLEHRDKLFLAQRELPKFTALLADAVDATDALELLLGGQGERRYLVLFQNNSELRPTGGFIGSFALIDVKDGEIRAMEIPGGGSYDLQGSLRLNLAAPQPLRLINSKWEFQDANWYPDFPASAAQLAKFYEKSGGPTVDGVVALNATLVEKLLAVTGPIEMPEYGKTIDSSNFFAETQKQVEVDYDRAENRPKAFIGDLAPRMLERLSQADRRMALDAAGMAAEAFRSKELQFWFRDADLQERLAGYGLDGSMGKADGDYLAVVHTNIGGQKTDLSMDETIEHRAKVAADGSVTVRLSIERTHRGTKGAMFSGVRNVDFLRVYVPAGAQLVEAAGFTQPEAGLFELVQDGAEMDPEIAAQEKGMRIDRASGTRIYAERGFTVFGNWVMIDPGETSKVTLTYSLPPGTAKAAGTESLADRLGGRSKAAMRYDLTVRRQSGAVPATFVSLIDLPRGLNPAHDSDGWTTDGGGTMRHERRLDTDFRIGLTALEP